MLVMQAQTLALAKRGDLVESEAAGRVAEMEEQMDRQRRALRHEPLPTFHAVTA